MSRHRVGLLATLQGEIAGEPRQRVHRVGHPVECLDGQATILLARPKEDDHHGQYPNHPPLHGIRLPHHTSDFTCRVAVRARAVHTGEGVPLIDGGTVQLPLLECEEKGKITASRYITGLGRQDQFSGVLPSRESICLDMPFY